MAWGNGRRHAPDLFQLRPQQVALLNDDRIGRCLDRLFDGLEADLILTVVRQVIDEFHISLDELHNDSTTVSFHGAYEDAQQEKRVRGRPSLAITHGHSKDHRPDLKQLLYILTVTEDGGVPVYFTSASGNTSDDKTHRQTWDLLRELVGHAHFLYVADCKLASSENLNYIARQQGRFITVLPRTRKEDQQFRQRLLQQPDAVAWQELYTETQELRCRGKVISEIIGRVSVCSQERLSEEGYRLLWYHSTRKAERDAHQRTRQLQRHRRAHRITRPSAKRQNTVHRAEKGRASRASDSRQPPGRIVALDRDSRAGIRLLSSSAPRPSRQADQLRQASQETVRSDLDSGDGPPRGGRGLRRHLPPDHERNRDDGRGTAAGLQTSADH